MAIKTFASLVNTALNEFGVQTDWFSTRASGQSYTSVASINVSGSLQTVLSLTGKYEIDQLTITGVTAAQLTDFVVTIDGVVVHSSISYGGSPAHVTIKLYGESDGDGGVFGIICDSSFLLEMNMGTDTSIDLTYRARPIR